MSWVASPPSAGTIQMCLGSASCRENAMRSPPGEKVGKMSMAVSRSVSRRLSFVTTFATQMSIALSSSTPAKVSSVPSSFAF